MLLAAACDEAASGGDGDAPTPPPSAALSGDRPVVMSARLVCRLASDSPDAQAAQITGVDGTQSAVAGGTTYWFFGDTVRRGPTGQDVIPASVATADDRDARDCLDLRFKQDGGLATPLFPRLDETTAWPDGVLPLDDGGILFYMVKAYRQSPFAWHVGAIGMGRVLPGSVEGVRVNETIWDEGSGFGARVAGAGSLIRQGDDVLVYLRLDDGRIVLARAPIAQAAEASAYEYRTDDGWSSEPADAVPVFPAESDGVLPADNGVHVTFDDRLGSWLAIYNAQLGRLEARTAPYPWGPWSTPAHWFDCRAFVMDRYPYCYSAQLHRHLTSADGQTIYITFSSQQPYDVALMELRLGAPVHAWRDSFGAVRYAFDPPGDGWTDAGVAFYASTAPAHGLSPVFERTGDGASTYTLAASGGGAPVFYAHSTTVAEGMRLTAVRATGGELRAGGDNGDVVFFVPCAGAPADAGGCE